MEKVNLHYNIAEKGKVYALKGNHTEALRHYKEALRMCQTLPNSDIFFQHYSLCAMELMGNNQEVIDFCEKCLEFIEDKEFEKNDLLDKYISSLWERMGIQYLLMNEKDEAKECFNTAKQTGGKVTSPLTNDLLNWIWRGYAITEKQIRDLEKRHNYFTVRKENVNEAIAIELPEIVSPTLNL
jgi:tetratricopeptide (TPR) repeat protein